MAAELTQDELDAEVARARAHGIITVNVGKSGENRYTAACSCGRWSQGAARLAAQYRAFDAHLAQANHDREQALCFCGRLVLRSPYAIPDVWYHANYMNEFYGHDPAPRASPGRRARHLSVTPACRAGICGCPGPAVLGRAELHPRRHPHRPPPLPCSTTTPAWTWPRRGAVVNSPPPTDCVSWSR